MVFKLELAHASIYEFHGYIHTLCDLLWCHTTIQEPFANHFYIFANLNDMSVGVVNSDHTLAPRMFLDWMNIFHFTLFKVVSKFIKVILFKINFGTIAAERNIVSTDKF